MVVAPIVVNTLYCFITTTSYLLEEACGEAAAAAAAAATTVVDVVADAVVDAAADCVDNIDTHNISTKSTHNNLFCTGINPYVMQCTSGHSFNPCIKSGIVFVLISLLILLKLSPCIMPKRII